MQKNLMIPTDFTIESLNMVKYALEKNKAPKVKVLFVYGVYLPDSITELLFFSEGSLLSSLITPDFREACVIIRNKYQYKVVSIETELFTGKTNAAFDDFIKSRKVDEAYIPKRYKLKYIHPRSFNCVPYFHKSTVPFVEVDWVEKLNIPEKSKLAELFLD
jgi:hypothetical protein